MKSSRSRLKRLEARIRETAGTCRTCYGKGPDALLAWVAEKEGRPEEAVKRCPECGRPARFRFHWSVLAADPEEARAAYAAADWGPCPACRDKIHSGWEVCIYCGQELLPEGSSVETSD